MAKTRRRDGVSGGSQVETPSSNDKIIDSAPSKVIKNKKEETNTNVGSTEEVEVKQETKVAPCDIPQDADEIQETENGLDEPEENDRNERDENEGDENIEEDENEGDENVEEGTNEGDENEEATDPCSRVEEENLEEDIKENEGVEAVADDDVTENEEIKEDGKVESLVDNVVAGSTMTENEKSDDEKDVKGSTEVENTPIVKAKRLLRKKAATNAVAKIDVGNSEKLQDTDKKEASADRKEVNLADGMGLIFMCNAKTKQDCFRYKVLGLPASKKELVEKIYKGMRLFLFDVDLKLLYGIFKAATPGGYNLEPKAFKSAYPAQVRFSVLNDCLPLPEEKFKTALKGNYYGRNKFNNQLSQEQVKSLCKLFHTANKIVKNKRPRQPFTTAKPEPTSSSKRQRRTTDVVSAVRAQSNSVHRARDLVRTNPRMRDRDHGKARKPIRSEPVRTSSHAHKRSRHERERRRTPPQLPSRREREAYMGRRDAYGSPRRGRDLTSYPRHEVYGSPPRAALPPPGPAAPYDYYYMRDPPPALPPPALMLDPRDRVVYRVADTRQPMPQLPVADYHDAYHFHREPHALYHDALYASSSASAAFALPPTAGMAPNAFAPPPPQYYHY